MDEVRFGKGIMESLATPQNLCIFLTSGKTFSFKGISIVTDNESVLVFNYTAMSDLRSKTATFLKRNMAGYSTHY